MDRLPNRAIVDLQAALAKFGNKAAQREVTVSASLDKPVPPGARYLLRLAPTDLARRHAAGFIHQLQPFDRSAVADAKSLRRSPTRKPFRLDRRHNPLAKIHRIGHHPCWPPTQHEG
jgi:hypothetical protein